MQTTPSQKLETHLIHYPLLLEPALHTRVWGGRRLETIFGKTLPTPEPYGESWELHDTTTVINGPLAGRKIGDLVNEYAAQLIGDDNNPAEGFPLLVKLLDASDWLSVQVHPDDEQARQLENDPRGKTEAWIVLAAESGAKLVIGVKPGTTREAMTQAIRENVLEDLLVYNTVQKGDVLFIRANTVHAIGPGLLIYEIQQSSDVTYRLYDWGRVGLDGKPRQLHIEKGVQVSNVQTLPTIEHIADIGATTVIVSCPYFTTVLHRLSDFSITLDTLDTFHALTCIEGQLMVEANDTQVEMTPGNTVLMPACLTTFTMTGTGKVLRSFQTPKR